jgi:hypothetical protein
MMPRLITLLFATFFVTELSAQFNDNAGGRSTGMAGAYVALGDGWSAFHNQAGLASVQTFDAGIYYENRFGLNVLSDKGLFVAARVGKGVFAGSYHSFGYAEFASATPIARNFPTISMNASRLFFAWAAPIASPNKYCSPAKYTRTHNSMPR